MDTLKQAISLRENKQYDEAKRLLEKLNENQPHNPDILYQCAWIHDVMGLEKKAIGYYEEALTCGLEGVDRKGALLGLGSTYRVLGLYDKSAATLEKGMKEFPDEKSFEVFAAMALYNTGKYSKAMEILLKLVAATSCDEGILGYKRAIEYYADKLDMVWEE
ncbi:tetratricopeptide repeat protein [Metabacillus idriensis]|uniref:tetratricopeptide repeat protein n=1 Tax=Metabacillus idriensis TaxID=324768 RepID=UPI00174E4308|nr:tetratricopeptide repeat protein [Metabacillus idriensis]